MALFEGENLACQRGEAVIFEDLHFALDPGACLWLAGPNGSGKSSLLRLMAGLLRPIAGRILWNGKAIHGDAEAHRGRLRYIGHLDAVKPHLTVAENLGFWAEYWGLPRTGAGPALARLGLGHLESAAARQLSVGQRRRLGLARLILGPAPLWLLDEPAAALDSEGVALLGILIAAQRDAGGSVVFSSHDRMPVPGAARMDLEPVSQSALLS